MGRGQPISLSLINSSRGDCNTAGDCWEKKDGGRGRSRGGGGENEIGMNGKVWRDGGTELEDGEKIGNGGKTGVRTERVGIQAGRQKIEKDKREKKEGRGLLGEEKKKRRGKRKRWGNDAMKEGENG